MNKITNHLPTAELQALDAAHHMHPFTSDGELAKKGVRVILSRYISLGLPDRHAEALAAMRAGDAQALAVAIREDIAQGVDQVRAALADEAI